MLLYQQLSALSTTLATTIYSDIATLTTIYRQEVVQIVVNHTPPTRYGVK